MFFKQFISVLLIALMLPLSALAQDAPPPIFIIPPPQFDLVEPMQANADNIPQGAFVTPMRTGQRAREDGVFYSLEANAWLLSEFNRIQLYWIELMDHRLQLQYEWAVSEIEAQNNRRDSEIHILEIQLEAERRRLDNLEDINDSMRSQIGWSRREKFRFAIAIIGVAAVVGLGGYYIGGLTAN